MKRNYHSIMEVRIPENAKLEDVYLYTGFGHQSGEGVDTHINVSFESSVANNLRDERAYNKYKFQLSLDQARALVEQLNLALSTEAPEEGKVAWVLIDGKVDSLVS
jgi:hypothetical protein